MANQQRSGAFIGGLLVGSALGAITGLLLAPRSGRETRLVLRKSMDAMPELVEDLSTSLQLQADRLSETALHRWEETLDHLSEAIAAGVEASLLERQRLQSPGTEAAPPGSPSTVTGAAEDAPA